MCFNREGIISSLLWTLSWLSFFGQREARDAAKVLLVRSDDLPILPDVILGRLALIFLGYFSEEWFVQSELIAEHGTWVTKGWLE